MNKTNIQPLIDIMATLRHPQKGCPWDLQQSHASLVSMTFEEMAELADAIAKDDSQNTCEELGDILFHLIFYARIAEESGDFSMQDVIDTVAAKMIRRHPHIFAGKVYQNTDEQKADWERIKLEEKALHPDRYRHLSPLQKMDNLPAIMQSIAMQRQLAKLGFDWFNAADVFAKIHEEMRELQAEIAADDQKNITEEYGDLLFAVLNLGRKLDIDPAMTLRKANHKFYARSEQMIQQAGDVEAFAELSMDDKEALWVRVKSETTKAMSSKRCIPED